MLSREELDFLLERVTTCANSPRSTFLLVCDDGEEPVIPINDVFEKDLIQMPRPLAVWCKVSPDRPSMMNSCRRILSNMLENEDCEGSIRDMHKFLTYLIQDFERNKATFQKNKVERR